MSLFFVIGIASFGDSLGAKAIQTGSSLLLQEPDVSSLLMYKITGSCSIPAPDFSVNAQGGICTECLHWRECNNNDVCQGLGQRNGCHFCDGKCAECGGV